MITFSAQPVDLDDVPVYFAAEDCISQEEVSSGILQELMRSSAESDNYDSRAGKDLTLAHLKTIYNQNLYTTVVQYMRKYKSRIVLTPDDLYSHRDPMVAWRAGYAHKLDYICAVGDRLGLHAALTDSGVNVEYEFTLSPKPHRKFGGKYAQLGFDQSGSVMYLGSRPGEEVYICMAPEEVLSPDFSSPPPVGLCSDSPLLTPFHARVMIVYIAFCLSQMSDVTSAYCLNPYSVPMPPHPMQWDFTSAL